MRSSLLRRSCGIESVRNDNGALACVATNEEAVRYWAQRTLHAKSARFVGFCASLQRAASRLRRRFE